MAFGVKEIVLYVRRPNYRLFSNHLFITSFLFVILHRFFPSLFALLVTLSPVTLCTALLLGIILTCGDQRTPKFNVDINAFASVEQRQGVKKMTVREAASHNERAGGNGKANSSGEQDKKVPYVEKKVTEERKIGDSWFARKKEVSAEGPAEGGVTTSDRNNSQVLKVEVDEPILNTRRHATLREAWDYINRHGASSSSESDQTECSSPDASSMTDMMPVLDEVHPLLDPEPPQPTLLSRDNSDVASIQLDDGSVEEETENQEDEDDGEVQDEKDVETKSLVTWTADDQKNLMELGKSEMERNQRLEGLIARRRARKLLEKSLIDLDSNTSVPSIEELSRFQIEIPSVFPPRRNPFDLPYDSDEIPLSAPPRLVPRENPFDLPFDQGDESGSTLMENSSQKEVVTNLQRDMLLRRHGSFAPGTSFLRDHREEKCPSRLKPYFVAENKDEEETDSIVPRESSEGSDSTVSSLKSDKISSATEELTEDIHRASEPLANHDTDPTKRGSQSSKIVHDVDVKQVQSKETEEAHDSQITHPVYDSSSSATEKTN